MTIQDRADEIAADFEFLDDWETLYAHIIDLGKANPHLEPEERTEDTKVRGCASQVWMVLDEAPDGTLSIRAESDAMIVSGLIALLIRLYSGAPREEIQAFDAPAPNIFGSLTMTAQPHLSILQRVRIADMEPEIIQRQTVQSPRLNQWPPDTPGN